MKFSYLFLISILIFILQACTSVPVSTMWKLRSFNPIDINAAELFVAIRATKHISIKNGEVTMSLSLKSSEGETKVDEVFKFDVSKNQDVSYDLLAELEPSEAIYIMSLSAQEAKRMGDTQQAIKKVKGEDPDAEGAMSISINAFCLNQQVPEDQLEANIYVKMEPQGEYLHLIRNLNLANEEINWEEAICKA